MSEVVKSTRAKSPKKPVDRKPKDSELLDGVAEVEYEGHLFEVNYDAMDDDELFDGIEETPGGQARLIRAVIGTEGQAVLRDIVRDDNGRARATKVAEAFGELMEHVAVKNS